MDDAQKPQYFSASEVAELLGIPVDEVWELLEKGLLSGARVGTSGTWRITRDSVRGYLDEAHEESRRRALWRQSQEASFPEIWAAPRLD